MASPSWDSTIPSINSTSDSTSNTSCSNNAPSCHHSTEITTGSMNLSYIWSPVEPVTVSNHSVPSGQSSSIMATHVITTALNNESSRLPQTMNVCMNRAPPLTSLASSVGVSLIAPATDTLLNTSVAQMPTIGSDTRITESTRITERVTLPNHVTTSLSTGISTAPTSTVSTVGNTTLLPAYTATQHLPPISKFSGDEKIDDNTTFPECLEQFEMVANIYKCNTLRGWIKGFCRAIYLILPCFEAIYLILPCFEAI